MARQRRPCGEVSTQADLPEGAPTHPEVDRDSDAKSICLRLLTGRAHTRAELAAALHSRGISDETCARVLTRFVEVGLIDDSAYAAGYVTSRHFVRGVAGREIARQLHDKGIDDHVVQEAVASIDSDADRAAATSLATRKVRAMSSLEPNVIARRLLSILARKGYSPDMSCEVVHQVLTAHQHDMSGLPFDDTTQLA